MAASSEAGVLERPAIKEKKPKSASAPKRKAKEGSRKRRPADPNARGRCNQALGARARRRPRGSPAQRLPIPSATGPVSREAGVYRRQRRGARFVEVKTRRNADKGLPSEAVTRAKRESSASPSPTQDHFGEAVVRFDVVGLLSCLRRSRLHPAIIWAPIRRVEPWRGVNAPSWGATVRGVEVVPVRVEVSRFRRPAGHGYRGDAGRGHPGGAGAGARRAAGAGFLHAGEKIVEPGAEPSAQDGVGVRPSHSLGIWRPRGRSIRLGRGSALRGRVLAGRAVRPVAGTLRLRHLRPAPRVDLVCAADSDPVPLDDACGCSL